MFKTGSPASKDIWSDIFFVIVVHLILLSLYVFGSYNSSLLLAPSKPQLPARANATVLGVCM